MNKKRIILSLSIIAAVAAVVIGATSAFYMDTETSNGNTFTAGKLDLIIDIDGVDENPLDGPIFSLSDMKPGDKGEKTISLKVNDNPACGFVDIKMTDDKDNECTEPEIGDEPACKGDDNGELNDQTQFVVFSDPDCDNLFEADGSRILTEGTLTENKSYAIGELPVTPEEECYGVAYCFGAPSMGNGNGITVDGHVVMNCDGANVDNSSQSDSFSGDLVFTAKQKRNQYDQGCPVGDVTRQ